MDGSVALFTLSYLIFAICFLYRTDAFISFGLTIEGIFSKCLGSEFDDFTSYHIRRSSCTLFIHSCLVLGYGLGLSLVSDYPLLNDGLTLSWVLMVFSIVLPVIAAVTVYRWRRDNWEKHPIAKTLALFCSADDSWLTMASEINTEFRRMVKLKIKSSSLVDVIVTENWLMKITPYGMDVAHQSDARVEVDRAAVFHLGSQGTGSAQYLDVKISYSRRGNHHFYIRLNALFFKDLEDKLTRAISVPERILLHRTKADHFLEVFQRLVSQNPPFLFTEDLELCAGCMVNISDVKLVKNCRDSGTDDCGDCHCRPMWCVGCLGRWFISRQEEKHSENWLSSKCTCPMCRSVFCILDISPL